MAEKAKNEPRDVSPATLSHLAPAESPARREKKVEVDLSEAREVNPFQIINRGEDTVDTEDRVTFADFSPNIRPADAPDPVEAPPKDESAPVPAPSSDSDQTSVQTTSDTTAQTPASEDDGQPSPNESSKQTSSSPPKSG